MKSNDDLDEFSCDSTSKAPMITNLSWNFENRRVQLTHMLMWVSFASLKALKDT